MKKWAVWHHIHRVNQLAYVKSCTSLYFFKTFFDIFFHLYSVLVMDVYLYFPLHSIYYTPFVVVHDV